MSHAFRIDLPSRFAKSTNENAILLDQHADGRSPKGNLLIVEEDLRRINLNDVILVGHETRSSDTKCP